MEIHACPLATGILVANAVIAAVGYTGLAAVRVVNTAAAWGLAMVVNRRIRETANPALAADTPA